MSNRRGLGPHASRRASASNSSVSRGPDGPLLRRGTEICKLAAGGNRIRTIGPALAKGLSAVAKGRCRTNKLDGVIKHRSSTRDDNGWPRTSLHGRLFLGRTDGSNPVPSSVEVRTRRSSGVAPKMSPSSPTMSPTSIPILEQAVAPEFDMIRSRVNMSQFAIPALSVSSRSFASHMLGCRKRCGRNVAEIIEHNRQRQHALTMALARGEMPYGQFVQEDTLQRAI